MPFDRSVSPFSFAPILAATLGMAAAQIATADGTRVSDAEPPAQTVREDPALAADLAILARFDVPFAERRSFRDATARQVIDEAAKAAGHSVEIDSQIVGGLKKLLIKPASATPSPDSRPRRRAVQPAAVGRCQ